jgi:hypothetical protein
MRTITIDITPEDFEELARNTDIADLTETIGYFATWGLPGDRFNTVHIYRDWHSKTDLVAHYSNDDEAQAIQGKYQRFTMGAVWRKDDGKFTFHS